MGAAAGNSDHSILYGISLARPEISSSERLPPFWSPTRSTTVSAAKALVAAQTPMTVARSRAATLRVTERKLRGEFRLNLILFSCLRAVTRPHETRLRARPVQSMKWPTVLTLAQTRNLSSRSRRREDNVRDLARSPFGRHVHGEGFAPSTEKSRVELKSFSNLIGRRVRLVLLARFTLQPIRGAMACRASRRSLAEHEVLTCQAKTIAKDPSIAGRCCAPVSRRRSR